MNKEVSTPDSSKVDEPTKTATEKNTVAGDLVADNATKNDFGKDNTFHGNVTINNPSGQDLVEQLGKEMEKAGNAATYADVAGDAINITGGANINQQDQRVIHNYNYTILKNEPVASYISLSTDEAFDLSDSARCDEFFERLRVSRHVVYACLLAFFELVPTSDTAWLTNDLYERLMELLYSENEDENKRRDEELFLSQDRILAAINATRSVISGLRADGLEAECVCFNSQETAGVVFEHIWRKFPQLHNVFVDWIFSALGKGDYYIRDRAISALTNIVTADRVYGHERVLGFMLDRDRGRYVSPAANILSDLIEDGKHAAFAESIVRELLDPYHTWHWKIPVLMFVWNVPGNYRGKMKDFIARKIEYIYEDAWEERDQLFFIGWRLPKCLELRDYVCQAIADLVSKKATDTVSISILFTILLTYSLDGLRVSKWLPFVVCDNREQLEALGPLYKAIMHNDICWQGFCSVIRIYFHRHQKWGAPDKRLVYFFQHIAFSSGSNFELKRVKQFLQSYVSEKSSVAMEIYAEINKMQKNEVALK